MASAHDRPVKSELPRAYDPKKQADVWSVRKAGLGLLISVKGDAKPIPGHRGCLGAGRAPGRVRRRHRGMVCAEHGTAAAYLRARQRRLPARSPADQSQGAAGIAAMKEMAHAGGGPGAPSSAA